MNGPLFVATEPEIFWAPTSEDQANANLTRFLAWVKEAHALSFDEYQELWRWSVDDLERFWESVWRFYDVRASQPYATVLTTHSMPGASWFEGARLNYAQQVLERATEKGPALVVSDESHDPREVSLEALRGKVGALAGALRELNVVPGDRVAAYVPNVEEAVVALLAVTSLGAVWTACSPEFGTRSVIDRFAQVEPRVLIAVDGYRFGGREYDRRPVVRELQRSLPTLEATILIRGLRPREPVPDELSALPFDTLVAQPQAPRYEQVRFDHPLWILFSSGTTGLPKGIVHGHGGIVLEHLKSLGLDAGLSEGDRWLVHSSTSWMAWNWLVGGLLHGATSVLYNGSPTYPSTAALWQLAARTRASTLLVGSGYVLECAKRGVELDQYDLKHLRVLNATGSPLAHVAWDWLHGQLGPRVRIDSTCGGTDVCTAFFGGNPVLPVYRGYISGIWLGVHAEAWDHQGRPLTDEPGEFVVLKPMPSMPLGMWNDPDDRRYRDSYFATYPGVWRQGDSITITSRGTVRVWGRSDATLNRGGVRLGSGEIYAALAGLPALADSLVVGVELPGGEYYMPLFVVPSDEVDLDDDLRRMIVDHLRTQLSPRHVPDEIVEAPAIPRTLTGKMLEVPIKLILQGASAARVASPGSIDRPDVLDWFEAFARRRLGARA